MFPICVVDRSFVAEFENDLNREGLRLGLGRC